MYICRRGRRTDAEHTRGPPRLSYAVSRPKTTVLYLSQVPWLERRTSPPPTMVSGSVFVVNAEIASPLRSVPAVECDGVVFAVANVSAAPRSAPLRSAPLTPHRGLLPFNKCCFCLCPRRVSPPPLLLREPSVAFAGCLRRLSIHLGFCSLPGVTVTTAGCGPPDLLLHFSSFPPTSKSSGEILGKTRTPPPPPTTTTTATSTRKDEVYIGHHRKSNN